MYSWLYVYLVVLCLFSCSESEMKQLLILCEKYARNWDIKFNVSKCNFIVFGTRKYDNSIFLLNNSKSNLSMSG
jgi:hypothetical protein